MKRVSEQNLAMILLVGVFLTIGGLLLFFFFLFGGSVPLAGFFGLLGLIGIIMLISALTTGLRQNRRAQTTTQVVRIDNAKVVARYALNSIGETLFNVEDIEWDNPKTRLFVRLEIPNSRPQEFRCNRAVWGQAAELMVGTALVQGDWLGEFTPSIGRGQGNPYEK